jgi:hypothetical protein
MVIQCSSTQEPKRSASTQHLPHPVAWRFPRVRSGLMEGLRYVDAEWGALGCVSLRKKRSMIIYSIYIYVLTCIYILYIYVYMYTYYIYTYVYILYIYTYYIYMYIYMYIYHMIMKTHLKNS